MTHAGFDLGGITPDDTGYVPAGVHPTAVIGEPPEHRDWREKHRVVGAFIHPTARVNAFCTIDGGKDGPTSLGAHSWMLAHSHLGHDAVVGTHVEISTGAVVGGGCLVMDGAKIGLNATILPKAVIGHGARIGAGSVVTKDVPAGETWAGNPARPIGDQDPDRRIVVGGVETTVGHIQSSGQRCLEEGRAMADRPHPIELAGTGAAVSAYGHPVDGPQGHWTSDNPKTLKELHAERDGYDEWRTTPAGERWFKARAELYADGGSMTREMLLLRDEVAA